MIDLDERRTLLLPVLLEEPLAADAVRHADHGERPIGEMRQHVRRDLRAVAQEIALGERRLLQRRIRRPVDAIEIREADRVRSTASVIVVFGLASCATMSSIGPSGVGGGGWRRG